MILLLAAVHVWNRLELRDGLVPSPGRLRAESVLFGAVTVLWAVSAVRRSRAR